VISFSFFLTHEWLFAEIAKFILLLLHVMYYSCLFFVFNTLIANMCTFVYGIDLALFKVFSAFCSVLNPDLIYFSAICVQRTSNTCTLPTSKGIP
jgi:hypothetical protein